MKSLSTHITESFVNEDSEKYDINLPFNDRGCTITTKANFSGGQDAYLVNPPESNFKYGRPLVFIDKKEATNFLNTKKTDYVSVYAYKTKSEDSNGQWGIFKKGGFSGNMTEENEHDKWGLHLTSFKNEKEAKEYCLLSNMSLQWGNNGGGFVTVRKVDGTTVAAYNKK